MIIVRCSKCGALLHKSERCFLCGNVNGFDECYIDSDIHENVKHEYENLELLISAEKYEDALNLSYLILEWMPNSSSVFWLRLMAKNKCKSDEELVRKGFCYEDSADYYNACKFANELQKAAYGSVIQKIDAVKSSLLEKIWEYEYREKEKLSILQYQEDIPSEMKKYENTLFSLWTKLEKTELDIKVIEKDFQLLVQEYDQTLLNANDAALSLKSKTYKLSECSEEEYYTFQIQLDDLLHLTEQASSTVEMMKNQHPWLTDYKNYLTKRDDLCSQIASELNKLKNYQTNIKSTINSFEDIEEKSQNARDYVEAYCFANAKNLLGELEYSDAFIKAGVR